MLVGISQRKWLSNKRNRVGFVKVVIDMCAFVNWKFRRARQVYTAQYYPTQPAARVASVVAALAKSHLYRDYTHHIVVLNTWAVISEGMCTKPDSPQIIMLPHFGILRQRQ